MARRRKQTRQTRKSKSTTKKYYVTVAIVLIVVVVLLYYFGSIATKASGTKFQIYGATYFMTYESCANLTSTPNSNITDLCTAILNVSSTSNSSVPYYMILNKYAFRSEADASAFLQALRSDLNTSPWYSNIPNAYYNSSIVYTTVVYPNYKNTNTSAEVLALYRQDKDVVISASTSNMTNNANNAIMKKYAEYLVFNYQSKIEGMK